MRLSGCSFGTQDITMLPIGCFLIFFLFGLSTAAAQGTTDLLDSAQVKVTGIKAGDSTAISRLKYNCCINQKGELSGLCFLEPSSRLVPTINITLDSPSKVTKVVVEPPADPGYGNLQFVYISYKTDSSEPKPTALLLKGDKRIFTKNPIDMSHVPHVKTLHLHFGKGDYFNNPCLRLKIMGYEQKDKPFVEEDPKLTTTTNKTDNTVTFKCTITPRKGFRHIAEWVLDDQKVITNKIQESTEEVVGKIHQEDLYLYLPDPNSNKPRNGLKCSVKICYDTNCDLTKSTVARESNVLTPTFTVSPVKLTLAEGEFGKVVIKLGGPPVLFLDKHYAEAYGTKYLRLEAEFSTNSIQSTCSQVAVVVHSEKNKECGPLVTDWTSPQTITIKAVTDGLYIKSISNILGSIYLRHFIEDANGKIIHIFQKQFENINVKVEVTNSDKSGECTTYGEPHLKTFDGIGFDDHSEGEFIAYQRDDYQVNVFLINCGVAIGKWTWASCNCGVAIKSLDEVVIFTSCPRRISTFEHNNVNGFMSSSHFRVYTFLNGDRTNLKGKFPSGMRVYSKNNGLEYYVTLPTGTHVTMKQYRLKKNLIDVVIKPSVSDWETSTGYCGYYNTNPSDDKRNRDGSIYKGSPSPYLEVWRQTSCSLFHGMKKDSKPIQKGIFCRCVPNSHSYNCAQHFDADTCSPIGAKNETAVLIDKFSYSPGPNACSPPTTKRRRSVENQIGNLYRTKRAVPTDSNYEDDVYSSFVFNSSFVYQEPTWPTKSGWTEAKARTYCEDYLHKNDAVKNCKAFLGTTFANEINSCIFDIKASDSTTFAQSTLGVIISTCLAEVEKEPPNVVDLKGGLKRTVLLSSLCLDNCNNKGTCKDGQCVCNDGYYGSVCSLTKDTPPTISYIPRDGLCNMRSRNCSRSEVFGTDIIKSPDLKCRLTPYNPETKIRDDSGQFMTTARYINFNLVLCPHDGKYGNFLIALSNNNGKDYSNDELLFMAYDSACFKCTINQYEKKGNCTQLKTGCFIGSKCYLPEELDANSHCRICDPDRNINNWSLNTEFSNCTKSDADHTVAIIAGVSTASAVAAILLIVIAVVVYKKCRRLKISPPSALDVKSEAKGDDPEKDQATVKQERRKEEKENKTQETETEKPETKSEKPENRMEAPINVAETTTGRKVWYTDTFSQFGQIQTGTRAKNATGKTKPKLGSGSRSSRRK